MGRGGGTWDRRGVTRRSLGPALIIIVTSSIGNFHQGPAKHIPDRVNWRHGGVEGFPLNLTDSYLSYALAANGSIINQRTGFAFFTLSNATHMHQHSRDNFPVGHGHGKHGPYCSVACSLQSELDQFWNLNIRKQQSGSRVDPHPPLTMHRLPGQGRLTRP